MPLFIFTNFLFRSKRTYTKDFTFSTKLKKNKKTLKNLGKPSEKAMFYVTTICYGQIRMLPQVEELSQVGKHGKKAWRAMRL